MRDGSYNAVAYIENPNPKAGVPSANYKFSLYDSQNILIAERTGTTYIMPGGITPVFTAGIDTGNRIVAHTYFALTDPSMTWERMSDPTSVVSVASKQVSNTDTMPQLSAIASNSSVADLTNVSFVGVVYRHCEQCDQCVGDDPSASFRRLAVADRIHVARSVLRRGRH